MSRYRNFSQARGTRTYLSHREEFGMTEEEKHATYLVRKAADEAAKITGVGWPLMPSKQASSTASDIVSSTDEYLALTAAHCAVSVAPQQQVPLSGNLFDVMVCEEEEELCEAPAP